MKERKVCGYCNEVIDGQEIYVECEDYYICEHCYENNFFTCDDCGKVFHLDDENYIQEDEKIVCTECLESDYEKCDDCGEYHSRNNMYYINNPRGSDYYVCEHCRDNYYICDNCGDMYYMDDMHWQNDYCYCDNCYEENPLYEYHEFNDWITFRSENEKNNNIYPSYYYGKEIELEAKHYSNVDSLIDNMYKYLNAVGMEDGSLDDGAEIVTHPESWEYLQENKQKYKDFFEKVQELEYGDNGSAGLHFHVTRPNEDIIARIIVIMESFKEEIKKLSRRTQSQIDSWASFLTDKQENEEEKIKFMSTKYLKEKFINGYHNRYFALNLTNYKTIEFRFFNGANNFEEFWGALQFIHNIMEVATDETIDLNTIKWIDLIKGEELIEQAKKQEVYYVDKNVTDTTIILEKLEKAKEKAKEDIKNTLKNMIKYINNKMSKLTLENIKANQINEISKTTNDLLNELESEVKYLNNIIEVYKNLDNYTMKTTKEYLIAYKKDKYKRYFHNIEKILRNYESEVMA